MNIEGLTYDQYVQLKEKFDNAENDTTPYLITEDDETIGVVGDVNKTEVKKHDYTISFAFPNTEHWKKRLENDKKIGESPNYIGIERTYKDVWVSPMLQTAVQSTFADLYVFFNMVTDDGGLRDLTEDEIRMALKQLNQEMCEAMYHAVATVLRISEAEETFMLITDVVKTVLALLDDFPEIINGLDFFTEKSSESM